MWDLIVTQIAKHPLTSAARGIGFFLLVVALVEADQILTPVLGAVTTRVLIFAVVLAAGAVLFLGPLLDAFAPYAGTRTHGYNYAFVEQHWHLLEDGSRKVEVTRDFVFHRPPREEELCDILFGSLGLTVDMLNYCTSDAITRIDQSRSDAIKVFWAPKQGAIAIGQVYRHVCSWTYPRGDTPYEKSFTIASRVHCYDFRLKITTDRPIRDVVIRRDSGQTKFWDNIRIFALRTPSYVGMIRERSAQMLLIEKKALTPGETYFALVYV